MIFKSIMSILMVAALSLTLMNCGSGVTSGGGDSIAPPESPHPKAYIRASLPPAGFATGVIWAIALHDKRKEWPSSIEVDWVRFYCTVNGQDVMVAGETASNNTGTEDGGLYLRDPWFGNNDYHEPLPAGIDLKAMTFTFALSAATERVWHWWGSRAIIPQGATRCWASARVRPIGNAIVQIGADWWKDQAIGWCGMDQCNYEAFASDWFGATPNNDWIDITAGK
jgi:hypothetical protein